MLKSVKARKRRDKIFVWLCRGVTLMALFVLALLLFHLIREGAHWLSLDFLNQFPSRFPSKAGIKSALFGTLWLSLLTAIFSFPIGIASALYLEEYAPKNRLFSLIEMNISNLAGMPSIVYGLLGLTVFVRFFGLEQSLWSGSLTMSLLIMPTIIIASKEAIRAVPDSLRLAAFALGAKPWQVIVGQVLPAALPGILTGFILSMSRAVGESAPLIMIGALSYVAFLPQSPSDPFTVLPVQIFGWASRPNEEFHGLAGAAILVLLAVLFLMNLGAVIVRQRFQRYRL